MSKLPVAAVLLALAAAGCVDRRSSSNDTRRGDVSDFIIGGSDPTPNPNPNPNPNPTPSTGGCYDLAGCYSTCADTACLDACDAQAPAGALDTFNTAIACAQLWCLNKKNTVSYDYKCMLDSSQTRLVNLDGTLPEDGTACADCLNNALAELFLTTCVTSSSVDCNPSACAAETAACLSN